MKTNLAATGVSAVWVAVASLFVPISMRSALPNTNAVTLAAAKTSQGAIANSVRGRIERLIEGTPRATNCYSELWEQDPDNAKRFRLRVGVARHGYYDTDGANRLVGAVFHLTASNRFYIEWWRLVSDERKYYGPFAGDPFQVLGSASRAEETTNAPPARRSRNGPLTNAKWVEPDNPLGLDEDMVIRFFKTGKAMQHLASYLAGNSSLKNHRVPASVEEVYTNYINREELGNDPFGQGKLRLETLEEGGRAFASVFSVGPDGVWDEGKPISAEDPSLRGDVGLEIELGTTRLNWLVKDAVLDYVQGRRAARYLAKRGPRAAARAPLPGAAVNELEFGPVVGGLRAALELGTTNGIVRLGQPIKLSFHIQNATDYVIQVAGPNWRQGDKMLLVTEDGGPVLDRHGRRVMPGGTMYSGLSQIQREVLQPGETASFGSCALEFLAEGSTERGAHPVGYTVRVKPGRYLVLFELRFDGWNAQLMDWQGELETGEVTVQVKE